MACGGKAEMVKKNRMNRVAAAMAAAALVSVAVPAANAQAADTALTPRIDLRVLVVDDGGSSVQALTASSATPESRTPASTWAARAAL